MPLCISHAQAAGGFQLKQLEHILCFPIMFDGYMHTYYRPLPERLQQVYCFNVSESQISVASSSGELARPKRFTPSA